MQIVGARHVTSQRTIAKDQEKKIDQTNNNHNEQYRTKRQLLLEKEDLKIRR